MGEIPVQLPKPPPLPLLWLQSVVAEVARSRSK